MKLSPRLEAIAAMIRTYPVRKMADIGTDHGYLPVYLVDKGIVKSAIASDLNPAPLESARACVEEENFTDQIQLRLGSGLETIHPKEVQMAVLAGMGGVLIANLMGSSPVVSRGLDYLILQPMQAQPELREWLQKNHYVIDEMRVVCEGEKYYEIMKVKNGQMDQLAWSDLNLGYRVVPSVDYVSYIEHRIRVQEQVMAGLKKGKRWEALAVAHEIKEMMNERLNLAKKQLM